MRLKQTKLFFNATPILINGNLTKYNVFGIQYTENGKLSIHILVAASESTTRRDVWLLRRLVGNPSIKDVRAKSTALKNFLA